MWQLDLTDRLPHPLTLDPKDEYAPSFAPDGERFAYVDKEARTSRLMLRNEAGGAAISPSPRNSRYNCRRTGVVPATLMAHLERALERAERMQIDFLKTYVRLPDRQQQRVVEFTHGLGIPVASHELLPAAQYGVDAIEHFAGTSRRGYATKTSALGRSYEDVVETLATAGVGITPTAVVPGFALAFSEQTDLFDTAQFKAFYGADTRSHYAQFMRIFGDGVHTTVDSNAGLLRELIERGALVGTGTDAPFVPFAMGLHAELRLYARAGLTPHQILHAATHESARISHVERDLGSIEPGELADMVVIDGDPLSDIRDSDNVVMVVKNGRVYTMDELLTAP